MFLFFLCFFYVGDAYRLLEYSGGLCAGDICLTHRYRETQCLFPNKSVSYRYRGDASECVRTTVPTVLDTMEHIDVFLHVNHTEVVYGGGSRTFDVVNVSSVSAYNNMIVFGISKSWSTDLDAHILVYNNVTSSTDVTRVDTFNPNIAFISSNDHYGWSVDVGKYFVVVGAPARQEIMSATPRLGAAFLYPRDVLLTNSPVELLAPGRPNDVAYGTYVMTVENRVFVGWSTGVVMFQCTTVSVACTVEKRFTRYGFARDIHYYAIGSLIFETINMRKELIEINQLSNKNVIDMNETAVLYNDTILLSCAPGYTGVNECVACEENFYAPHLYAASCLACPDGFVSTVAATVCTRPDQPIFIDRSWGDVADTMVYLLVVTSFLIVLSSCFFGSCYPASRRMQTVYDLSGL